MNRCQVDETLDTLFHLGRDDATLFEQVAALHDAMANGVDFVQTLQRADFRFEQHFEHQRHAFLVRGQVGHDGTFVTVVELHLDESLIQTDTFYTSLCQYGLVVHVVQFILNGTATAV